MCRRTPEEENVRGSVEVCWCCGRPAPHMIVAERTPGEEFILRSHIVLEEGGEMMMLEEWSTVLRKESLCNELRPLSISVRTVSVHASGVHRVD